MLRGETFSEPTCICADMGCVDPRSVVEYADGILFRGPSGVHILKHDLTTQAIGRPIDPILSQYPTVTSACVVEAQHEVRMTVTDGVEGRVLVWNYLYGQWSVFWLNDISHSFAAVTGAMIPWQGAWVHMMASSTHDTIVREDSKGYVDTIGTVGMTVETGWLTFGALQGYKTIRQISLLGQYIGPHSLTLTATYNFSRSPNALTQQRVFSSDEILRLNGIIVVGDTSQVSGWTIAGANASNTDGGKIYWTITLSPPPLQTIVTGYRDLAHTHEVCVGAVPNTSGGLVTLAPFGGSGLTLTCVAIAGAIADTAAANSVSYADGLGLTNAREQVQIHCAHQKCESVKLVIDIEPIEQGQNQAYGGARWTGLSFELGMLRGHHKLGKDSRK